MEKVARNWVEMADAWTKGHAKNLLSSYSLAESATKKG